MALNRDNLTFTPDNWSQSQAVIITAVDDDYDEGESGHDNQSFTVRVKSVTSSDAKYNLDNASFPEASMMEAILMDVITSASLPPIMTPLECWSCWTTLPKNPETTVHSP